MITFRAIRPSAFNLPALESQIRTAQRQWMTKVVKEYQKTTEHWKHKVAFSGQLTERGIATKIEVGYNDEVYGYVDEGTRPHVIRPKSAGGVLAFPSSSAPKTRPGSLKSTAGTRGSVDVFTRKVNHPGTKAREFSKQIKSKMEPILESDMQAAMGRGAKKSGHAI